MAASVESLVHRVLGFNPAVAVLELRTRLRGRRPYWVMFSYGLIASLTLVIALLLMDPHPGHHYNAGEGRGILMALGLVQLTLVLLILPAYAAGSIALEREKKTLDLVQASLLSPADVVSGKLLSVMAFGSMLLLAALPVAAWCMLLGGVSPSQLVEAYVYLFAVALEVTALGLVLSAACDRAVAAVVLTYAALLLVLGGLPLIGVVIESFPYGSDIQSLLEAGFAICLLLVVMGVFSGLLYLALHNLGRRIAYLHGNTMGVSIPAGIAIGAGLYLLTLIISASSGLSNTRPDDLMVFHPYVVLAGTIETSIAGDLLGTTSLHSVKVTPLLVWAVNTTLALLFAAFLWLSAIHAYRRKCDRT
jgi:hypothetical protein